MKYFTLVSLLITSLLLFGCASEPEKSRSVTDTPSGKTAGTVIDDHKTILKSLQTQGEEITVEEIGDGIHTGGVFYMTHTGDDGSIILPESIFPQTGEVNEKFVITSGHLILENQFGIQMPKGTVSRGVVYNTYDKLQKQVFINTPGYDNVIAPKGIGIVVKSIGSASGASCSGYDLEHFDLPYWKNLEKKGLFMIEKQNINNIHMTISYEKKYYSDDVKSPGIFNRRQGISCFIKADKQYIINASFMSRKEISNTFGSFYFVE